MEKSPANTVMLLKSTTLQQHVNLFTLLKIKRIKMNLVDLSMIQMFLVAFFTIA